MANFRTYKDRNEDRFRKRALATGIIGGGLFALASNKNLRHIAAKMAGEAAEAFGRWTERRFGKDITRGILAKNPDLSSLNFGSTPLARMLESAERLANYDLPQQAQRLTGARYLEQVYGWAREDAELIFRPSNVSYDILREDPNRALAQPYYRKHVLPHLSRSMDDLATFTAEVTDAVTIAKHSKTEPPDKLLQLNNALLAFLEQRRTAPKTGIGKAFANAERTLSDFIDHSFETSVQDALYNLPDAKVDPSAARKVFFQRLAETHGELSQAQLTYARAAFAYGGMGQDAQWAAKVGQIRVGMLGGGGYTLNLAALQNFASAAFERIGNEFQIPVAPGFKGLQPFKFMPWLRGRAKDLAGTLHAGTKQREIYEALSARSGVNIDDYFDANGVLKQDIHYLGNKLLGIEGEWIIRDTRSGFMNEFERIRNANAPNAMGRIREWFGDSFVGKVMDFLGIDRQGSPSILSTIASVPGRHLFPESAQYRTHPLQALRRLMDGSNSVDDIESLLIAVRAHSIYPENIPLSSIFTDSILDTLHPGFQKLIRGGLSETDLRTAFAEIDDIIAGRASTNRTFFTDVTNASQFHGRHTKLTARRLVQDEAGFFAEGVDKSSKPEIANLSGLLGEPDKLYGVSKLRETMLEEIIQQLVSQPGDQRQQVAQQLFHNIMSAKALSFEQRQQLFGTIWASYQEKALHYSLVDQAANATKIAESIRSTRLLSSLFEDILKTTHPTLSPWVNPSFNELEGVGASLYATPVGTNGVGGVIKALGQAISRGLSPDVQQSGTWFEQTFEPISALFRETTAGYGNAVNPGFFYHSGYRLNQMLADLGLGLPDKDMQTTADIYKNLLLKRALPVLGAVEAWKYLNYESNEITGWSPSEGAANIRARYHLLGSAMADRTGMTDRLKKTVAILQGLDQYWEPRSYQEQLDYLNEGYEPVRRGRYWLMGSRTMWLGDKVSYFSPSWYQLQTTNWQGANNVDLNNDAYWSRSLIPTPRYPLSPLMRLVDPYAWEKRHSMGPNADRPYVKSGPLADQNTLIGSLINATLGKILKPSRTLYPEYLDIQNENDDGETQNIAMFGPAGDYTLYSKAIDDSKPNNGAGDGAGSGTGGGAGGGGAGGGGAGGSGTGSGGAGGGKIDWKKLPRIRTEAAKKGYGLMAMEYRPEESATANKQPLAPETLSLMAKKALNQSSDILGIYGFMSSTATERLGIFDQREAMPVIETADRAYGLERRWYDRDLGGMGGSLNELLRRFIVHRDRAISLYNPVPNNMPDWLPGEGALINLQVGDPYTKYKLGELRLPGEAYEMIHQDTMLPLLRTRASKLGRPVEELVKDMLGRRDELSEFEEYVTEFGTRVHAQIQAEWDRLGVIEAYENRVIDQEHNISGHFDAILKIHGERMVADIKTVSAKKYHHLTGPLEQHMMQLNMYMHELGLKKAQLYYMNRENPADPIKVYTFNYSTRRYNEAISKVNEAKARVVKMINNGTISRGDLYDAVTRAEILAETQPWSTEYKAAVVAAEQMVEDEDDPLFKSELNKRLQAAKKRAALIRKQYRIYNYRFNQPTETTKYKVKRIISANAIEVEGADKTVVRLAGVSTSNKRIRLWMEEHNKRVASGERVIDAFYRSLGIYPGADIKVVKTAGARRGSDQLKSIKGAVYAGNRNINRTLLTLGVGKEDKDDWSGPGVLTRFNLMDRLVGSMWESFAHLDLPWWNKLLSVNSALELYKRKQVYGTVAGDWAAPWSTYMRPTMDAMASRNILSAAFTGGLIGSFFMRSQRGKIIGAAVGAAIGAGLSLYGTTVGFISGERFIPKRVQKRRELEEYYDVLKYIKYKRLEAQYAERAKTEDRINLAEVERRQKERGEAYQAEIAKLTEAKRKLKLATTLGEEERAAARKRINQYQKGVQAKNRAAYPISDNMARSLLYREKASRTMTGADPYGRLDAVLAGFPRYERELIASIVNDGTKYEKQELFALLTKKQKSILGHFLGAKKHEIPTKQRLQDYFKTHVLPDASWKGWEEDFSLEHARVIAAQEEGINPIEMGIYPRNILDAQLATKDVPIPTMQGRTDNIRETLYKILGAQGLQDIEIELNTTYGDRTSSNIDVEIKQDRTKDIVAHFR